jgi:membrane protein
MPNVSETLQPSQNIFDRLLARAESFRVVGNFVTAANSFSQDRCSLIAAALSYYTLLAIFPLLLFLVALASFFLQSENATRAVIGFFNEFVPQSSAVIRNNLPEISRARGEVTLIAFAGLAWTASGVFNTVQLSLNRVFRTQRARPLWRERLVSMVMVIGVGLLFAASFAITTTLRLTLHLRTLRGDLVVEIVTTLVAILLAAIVFAVLYRLVPYDSTIRWRAVLPSALLAAALWEGAKFGFVWYLTNVSSLNMVYGSIGAIIALMLWGYLTWMIILYCAELAAVGMGVHMREVTGKEWWAAIAH